MRTIYLDGQIVKVNDQIIETFTPGVFRAQGVFETMLGQDGVIIDLAWHLRRLQEGLKFLKIKAPSIGPSVLNEVLLVNELSSARVRIMVWRAGKKVNVMIAALPYKA